MDQIDKAIAFYERHYDVIGQWILRPGTKVVLRDNQDRVCRFCGQRPPEATFRRKAHAIPEALGNKSLTTRYECDTCNEAFGRGIETHLGYWSKPMRTFARIRGKSGVPTLVKGTSGGWRIEYDARFGFDVRECEDDPIHQIDEGAKTVTFELRRDTYVPVAVLKAFVKIGLTLMPGHEMANFAKTLVWIRELDHRVGFVEEFPIIYTFQPGPMPNDLIVAFVLRRKAAVSGVPYAFLVLGYGNEVFQVALLSREQDGAISGRPVKLPPYPAPGPWEVRPPAHQ